MKCKCGAWFTERTGEPKQIDAINSALLAYGDEREQRERERCARIAEDSTGSGDTALEGVNIVDESSDSEDDDSDSNPQEETDMPPRESPKLNLDALIIRQDMAVGKHQNTPDDLVFSHHELVSKGGATYAVLRKPDFQRSTSEWTPEKVHQMITAFVEGDTVPAIIVWRSPENYLFVIDGAHRLSSIIAWINDDYGDGDISLQHYGVKQNQGAVDKVRQLIDGTVGSYAKLVQTLTEDNPDPQRFSIMRKLNFSRIPVQQLKNVSDATAAERAFLKINAQGVALSETEKRLIHYRNCPNAIAARAISLKGTGGAYWDHFDSVQSKKVSELAAKVYDLLFTPDLDVGELKTADLPIAGSSASADALGHIFQLVSFANGVPTKTPSSRAEAEKIVPPDPDGVRTIQFLQKTKRVASLLSNLRKTDYSYSADLHPFVYFYSQQGRHQPTMFLAAAYWLSEMDKKRKMPDLAVNGLRGRLEDFLLDHSFLIPAISRQARGEERAVRYLKKYLELLFENLGKNLTTEQILALVEKEFGVSIVKPHEQDEERPHGSRISISVKNSIFVEKELRDAWRCELCNARIPARAKSPDHRIDIKFKGDGSKDNVAPTHHACNSAKDKIRALNAIFRGANEKQN